MKRLNRNLGYLIISALSLLPVFLWVFAKPISLRFATEYTIFSSIGQITGLIGMTLFALNFILASRLNFLEDFFNGMSNVYFAHRLFGTISFILLLIHPIVLIARFIPISLSEAVSFIIPSTNWPLNFGTFSLLLMMIFLTFTIYNKIPYHYLKITHKFLGLSFFFASLHAFLIPSDVSLNLPLKLYMIFMVSTGITFFAYRSIFSKYLVKKTKYIVDSISYLNNKTVEIAMSPLMEGICFMPGQFIFISFYDKNLGFESHPFSISSSCKDNKLRLTIKSIGDFTSKLKNLETGTVAQIEGPFGRFYNTNTNRDQVWIAGGVGITPFLSMAKSINGSSEKIDLLYISKNPGEIVCLDGLCEISKEKGNFKVIPYYTEMQGRISAEAVERLAGGLSDKIIYLCGPALMMKSLKTQFAKLNIPKENIRLEEFSFL